MPLLKTEVTSLVASKWTLFNKHSIFTSVKGDTSSSHRYQ